jgi:hypothetical protein
MGMRAGWIRGLIGEGVAAGMYNSSKNPHLNPPVLQYLREGVAGVQELQNG